MEFIGWVVWLQGERQKLNGNGKTVAPRQAKAVPSHRTPNYGNVRHFQTISPLAAIISVTCLPAGRSVAYAFAFAALRLRSGQAVAVTIRVIRVIRGGKSRWPLPLIYVIQKSL
jgi:hypothetical protein